MTKNEKRLISALQNVLISLLPTEEDSVCLSDVEFSICEARALLHELCPDVLATIPENVK